jgi:flagellar biosynthesis protein FlhF
VRTFEAEDMKRALQRVRDELGPNAVIISSRPVRRDRGLFGLLARSQLQVTAATEEPRRDEPPAIPGSPPPGSPRESRSTSPPGPGEGMTPPTWTEGARRELRALEDLVRPLVDEVRTLREAVSKLDERSSTEPAGIRSDLAEIRSLLGSLLGSSDLRADAQGAAAQRLLYLLLGRGVDEPLARSLVQRVVSRAEPGALADLERLRLDLAAEMRADLARAEPAGPPRRIQIFVGPTGVGKTTTITKLAARAARSSANGVRIVTTDVHRVGAREQMARFGASLGLPVESAAQPEDLARIVERVPGNERLFVDTPGRSYRDPASLGELRALAESVDDAELMLVTSITQRAADSREILDAYAALPVSRMVVTKLDETRVYGELYNAVAWSGRPIAAVTTGQAVPDHLEMPDLDEILERVLEG